MEYLQYNKKKLISYFLKIERRLMKKVIPDYLRLYNNKSFQDEIVATKGDPELIKAFVFRLLKEKSAYNLFNSMIESFHSDLKKINKSVEEISAIRINMVKNPQLTDECQQDNNLMGCVILYNQLHSIARFQIHVFNDIFQANNIECEVTRHIFYSFPEKDDLL